MESSEYIYSNETYKIIGAAMEVHKELGCGFSEYVYQEALMKEFEIQHLPFEKEKIFVVSYKGQILDKEFRTDFICYNKIVVELKAVDSLVNEHYSQVLNYLKVTGLKLGLLINFGEASLVVKRIIRPSYWDKQSVKSVKLVDR
ncbi:MAG: GxxExxY protein [Paludibacteraceae bacterium]|nr:GxxExxY protein [Paludibacteraceae bacterium]